MWGREPPEISMSPTSSPATMTAPSAKHWGFRRARLQTICPDSASLRISDSRPTLRRTDVT